MKGIYTRNNHVYTVLGFAKSKNHLNGKWEKHVLYIASDTGEYQTREVNDFKKKFSHVDSSRIPKSRLGAAC